MEDIKIWTLDGSKATLLESFAEMESEKKFETILANNPNMLLNGLTLVGRQTPTEGGPLDLLGVDRYGRLCVFELKRNAPARDAVAQVIDYASDLDRMGWADLCSLISENSGWGGTEEIEDFEAWYNQDYGELDNLKPLRLFLVGLGADDRTERMVKFLAGNRLDISLLTFHRFDHAGKTLLAKQVGVDGYAASERGQSSRRQSASQRWADLLQLADDSGARELFDSAVNMFRETWSEDWRDETPLLSSLRIDLVEAGVPTSEHPYVRVEIWDRLWVSFHQNAFTLCEDAFERALESMEYRQSPPPPQSQEGWNNTNFIQFPLTADYWKRHKETLTALAQAVYDAWMENGGDSADETDSAE